MKVITNLCDLFIDNNRISTSLVLKITVKFCYYHLVNFKPFYLPKTIRKMQRHIETNLQTIATQSIVDYETNNKFMNYLQQLNTNEIDDAVYELEHTIAPQIDCTQCGNCCKTLMINVEEKEATHVAQYLGIGRKIFDEEYIEKSTAGKMLISKIPCHFLANNKCTIYLNRFAGCKEFPALHLPQIQKRLFTVLMHYGRCPIIFNVMENLKLQVGFTE